MNVHALIPLIAVIAYIPLLVILWLNRPWDSKRRFFFLFLVPALLWSLGDFFFRIGWFTLDKFLIAKIVLCIAIWMGIQFHYFLRSFYRPQRIRIPFAYTLLVAAIVLAILGYIPQSIDVTGSNIVINYGFAIVAVVFSLFILISKDIYSLIQKLRVSTDPMWRNQTAYSFVSLGILAIFGLASFTPVGEEFPIAHIGNLAMAGILTYAVVVHHLLDIGVVLRRALIWLGLGIIGVAAYVGLFFSAHLVFGFDINPATIAAASGVAVLVAVFVYWLLGVLRPRVERTFVGEMYDYRRELFGFSKRIYDTSTLYEFGSRFISLLSQSINCQRAGLLLPQVESGDFAARFSYPPLEDNPVAELELRHDSPIVTWLEREGDILFERNLSIFPEFRSMWQEEKEAVQSAKVELFAPLKSGDKLVAILALGSKRNEKLYTIEDIDLVKSIASRVATAMEKEYLREQLKERSEELAIINRLITITSSGLDTEQVFGEFIQQLNEVVSVDYAAIALIEGDKLHFWALSSQVGSVRKTGDMVPLEETTTKWVCEQKRSLYEADLQRFSRFPSAEHYIEMGIRSVIHLPLPAQDRAIGSLIIASRQPDAYSPKQIRLLERLALQIAMPVENSRLYAQAKQRARIDELTGLFNRRHFEERLNEEIARHSRHGGIFSLLMLDLDHFKTYNDIYGHPWGDELLRQIGDIIKSSIRNGDEPFRYGGDEFTIILPETSVNDAYIVAGRIREQIASEMKAKESGVTCSIGVAGYPSDGALPAGLVTTADTALYYAKQTGGNRVYLSSRILSGSVARLGDDSRHGGSSAVYALGQVVEARDPYTYGHSRKVNAYAVALAETIGLPPDEVSRISTAALLHDVGKVGIPDKILNKKEKLSAADWEIIESHSRLGANIVGNVPNLVPCTPIILHHHERWDGSGYPEGLKEENIPLGARVLAIADAFDAMTSERPYRGALSHKEAVEELRKGAGIQFDPKLVEVFIGIAEAGFPGKVKVGQNPSGELPDS